MKTGHVALCILLLVGVALYVSNRTLSVTSTDGKLVQSNVAVIDDMQIISLTAKNGYTPTQSSATANVPSILRVSTNATFDCTSSIVIPSLGFRNDLPATGTTDIIIPPQPAGTTLYGTCSMGMNNFAVTFN